MGGKEEDGEDFSAVASAISFRESSTIGPLCGRTQMRMYVTHNIHTHTHMHTHTHAHTHTRTQPEVLHLEGLFGQRVLHLHLFGKYVT